MEYNIPGIAGIALLWVFVLVMMFADLTEYIKKKK